MRFTIKDGVPYMVSQGMLYPLDIVEGAIYLKDGKKTDEVGYLSFYELLAKYPNGYKDKKPESASGNTSKPSTKKAKKDVNN